MTPDTHTYWDPSQGKYVTIPLASVIKPPSGDAELRRKSLADDSVVCSAIGSVAKGFLILLIIFIVVVVATTLANVFQERSERQYPPTTRQAAGLDPMPR